MNKDSQNLVFESILDVIYDGIFITDNHGLILYVNDAFVKLCGVKKNNIIGKSIFEISKYNYSSRQCTPLVLEKQQPVSIIVDYYEGKKKCLASGTPVFINNQFSYVVTIIRDITELESLRNELESTTSLSNVYKQHLKELEVRNNHKAIIDSRSKIMSSIYYKALKIADINTPVLLLGETGVGKDFFAKFIHEISNRNQQNFIKVNCGAIPDNLLESELFGYEAGAFTGANKFGKAGLFELADQGTLFLDEIGEMPLNLQVKILGAIQDKEILRVGGTKAISLDARIIAATNVDIDSLIEKKLFRQDLYYRLNVIEIRIPPLRERREDIITLAKGFIDEFNKTYNSNRYFSHRSIETFLSYHWPGNIRELRNTIERMVIFSENDCIEPDKIMLNETNKKNFLPTNTVDRLNNMQDSNLPLKQLLNNYEVEILIKALQKTTTLKEAAKLLEIDISTLVRKKQKFEL